MFFNWLERSLSIYLWIKMKCLVPSCKKLHRMRLSTTHIQSLSQSIATGGSKKHKVLSSIQNSPLCSRTFSNSNCSLLTLSLSLWAFAVVFKHRMLIQHSNLLTKHPLLFTLAPTLKCFSAFRIQTANKWAHRVVRRHGTPACGFLYFWALLHDSFYALT